MGTSIYPLKSIFNQFNISFTPAQHHLKGQGRRPQRLWGADRLRPGLSHVPHPGRQESHERRGADSKGELCRVPDV